MTYETRLWMTFVSCCKSSDLKRINRFILRPIALIDVERGHVDVADQNRGQSEKKNIFEDFNFSLNFFYFNIFRYKFKYHLIFWNFRLKRLFLIFDFHFSLNRRFRFLFDLTSHRISKIVGYTIMDRTKEKMWKERPRFCYESFEHTTLKHESILLI